VSTPLSLDKINELLAPRLVAPEQYGPVRWYDKEMRCSNRGCGSPTYIRIQGVPRCMIHAVKEMNEMLYEAGFKGVT
jgi:hypothetical protein